MSNHVKKISKMALRFYLADGIKNFTCVLILIFTSAFVTVYTLTNNYAADIYVHIMGSDIPTTDMVINETIDMSAGVMQLIAVLCMVVSVAGVLGLLNIKEAESAAKFTVMRVFGMTLKHARWFACFDAVVTAVLSGFFGAALGLTMFYFTARNMIGISVDLNYLLVHFTLRVVLTNIILFVPLLYCCYAWMYTRLFKLNMIGVLQKRETSVKEKISFGGIMRGIVIYISVFCLLIGDWSIIFFVIGICVVMLIIYKLFALAFKTVRKRKVLLKDVKSLAFLLLARRRRFTAMIGASVMVFVVVMTLLYNALTGIDSFLNALFIRQNGYNTMLIVPRENENGLTSALNENGFSYYISYTAWFDFSPGTIGSEGGRRYSIGMIRDDLNIVPQLIPKAGEFFANGYFIAGEMGIRKHTDELFTSGVAYTFNIGSNSSLTLTGELPNHNMSGPGSYSLVIPLAENIPSSFLPHVLMNLTDNEIAAVKWLAEDYNAEVVLSTDVMQEYRDFLEPYFIYLYMAIAMVIFVCIVFFISVNYAQLLSRKREFTLYKTFGATKRQIDMVIAVETALIALISSVTILFLNLILFNAVSLFAAGALLYMPIAPLLTILAGSVLFITAVSFFTSRATGKTINILRVE